MFAAMEGIDLNLKLQGVRTVELIDRWDEERLAFVGLIRRGRLGSMRDESIWILIPYSRRACKSSFQPELFYPTFPVSPVPPDI